MGYCNDMARSCLCADCKNTECENRCRLDCGYENFEKVTECEDYEKCPSCGADMNKPNCVTCDHFGKCEGCEKGEEE